MVDDLMSVRLLLESVSLHIDGRTLLRDVSLQIAGDGVTVILGPNGAGKTLLMKLCHGLLAPTRGRVALQSDDPAGAQPLHTLISQTPVMLKRSVLRNVVFALDHLPAADRLRSARAALEWAGIAELADRPAQRLSLGQQQLVALARARAMGPDVLFLDEPTASLDPGASRRVESLIRDLSAAGCKIIMSTHNLSQARRIASDIIFLAEGFVAEQAEARCFFESPVSAAAREFLAEEGVA